MTSSLLTKSTLSFLVIFSLAACGGSSNGSAGKKASGFATGAEMSSALNTAGLPCIDYKVIAKDDREMGQENALDVGECDVEGETVQLVVWKDNGQRDNFTGMGKALGCSMGEAFGITTFDFVDGDRWQVTGTSETLSNKIADKLEGKAVHIKC